MSKNQSIVISNRVSLRVIIAFQKIVVEVLDRFSISE